LINFGLLISLPKTDLYLIKETITSSSNKSLNPTNHIADTFLEGKKILNMSNKAWDVAVKNLTKAGILKVTKEDEVLYIQTI
jgi:hypothetical protein